MIKNTIRFASYVLVFFGASAQSCSSGSKEEEKPDCYICTYDGDAYTYCFSDYKENYGWTRSEFEAYIDYLKGEGYTCKAKK